MCKSMAMGGRRCVTSLEPAFKDAIKAFEDNGKILDNQTLDKLISAVRAYASTRRGYRTVFDLINKETLALLNGEYKDFDFQLAMMDSSYLHQRQTMPLAREYFIKNIPYISLLQECLTEGATIDASYTERENAYNEIETQQSRKNAELAKVNSLTYSLTYSQGDRDGEENELIGLYHTPEDAHLASAKFIFDYLAIENVFANFEIAF